MLLTLFCVFRLRVLFLHDKFVLKYHSCIKQARLRHTIKNESCAIVYLDDSLGSYCDVTYHVINHNSHTTETQ